MAGKLNLNIAEGTRVELTKKQEKQIRALYNRVSKNIEDQASKLPKNTSGKLREMYLKKLKEQVDHQVSIIDQQIKGSVQDNMKAVAQAVVEDNLDFLKAIGMPVEGAFSHVPDAVVRSIATGKVYGGKWSLSQAIWGQDEKTHSDISKIVAEGVAQNKSAFDIAKDLEKYVNPNAKKDWDWSKVYPGTNKKVDYNAQRLARTLVSHAYQQSFVMTTQKNPFVTKYKWLASNSSRTCELCASRNGQLFDKDELPLDHPNGMCTFEAVMPDSMMDMSNRLADWAQGKEDPALDEYAKSIFPGIENSKPQEKGPPPFNDIQKKWLEPLGFSPDKMPQDFKEFAMELTFDQQSALLHQLGGSWHGTAHPYQLMEKWYNETLLGGKPLKKIKPKTISDVKKAITQPKVSKPSKVPKAPKTTKAEAQVIKGRKLLNDMFDGQYPRMYIDQANSWWSSLTPGEQSGIRTYTGKGYTWMNQALRAGKVGERTTRQKNTIKNCQSALLKYKSDSDMVVRRGSDFDTIFKMCGLEDHGFDWLEKNKDSIIGSVASDDGFLSTSPISGGGFSGGIEYRIFVPKGSPAPYVDRFSQHSGEQEVLLPAGSMHRITDIERKSSGRYVVYMEFLGIK